MKLTKASRQKIPAAEFGLPETRGYPMPDKNHARLAKSGASRAKRVGNISEAEKQRIDAKADRILGKSTKGKKKKSFEGATHGYNWRNRHGLARTEK